MTLSASICTDSPTVSLADPADGAQTSNSLVVASGQATPGYNFTVLNNTNAVASATVDSDGSYAVGVPLQVGANAITVHLSLPGCAATADTDPVTVTRLAPPTTPAPQPASQTGPAAPSTPAPATQQRAAAIPEQAPVAAFMPKPGQKITATASGMKTGTKTLSSQVLIAGIAYPGAQVNIFQDGLSLGWVTADDSGRFLLRVALHYGDNIITIVAPPLKTVTLVIHRSRDYTYAEWAAAAVGALTVAAFGAHVLIHHRRNPHHPAYAKLRWPPPPA